MPGMVVMRLVLAVFAFVAVFVAPSRADALLCVAILGCSCTVTATPVEFDSFSALAGAQEAEGEIEVDCTGIAELTPSIGVRLNAGQHGTIAARQMRTAGGDQLAYNVYTTDGHGVVWGDGTSSSAVVNLTGGLLHLGHWQVTRTVHGLAAPLVTTRPGSYSDQIVVRIDW